MAKPKRKLTSEQRKARRNRKRNYMMIFINGKQKWVPRPQRIGGLPVEEYLARNADPAWLLQNGYWEMLPAGGQQDQPDPHDLQNQPGQLDQRDHLDQDDELDPDDHLAQDDQIFRLYQGDQLDQWENDEIPF